VPDYIVLLKRDFVEFEEFDEKTAKLVFPYYIVLLKPYVGKVHSLNKSMGKLVFNIFERRNF